MLLCIRAQTQGQHATCFTPLKQSWRNQSSNSQQRGKENTQSIRFEPLIQSPVTAVYSPVTAPFTFPLLDPSLSLFPPCFSVFLSVSVSFYLFFFLPASSLSPPDPLPCLLLHRMSLHCTLEPCFYGTASKQSKSAGCCSANV